MQSKQYVCQEHWRENYRYRAHDLYHRVERRSRCVFQWISNRLSHHGCLVRVAPLAAATVRMVKERMGLYV